MVESFLNMILSPFYAAFENVNLETNMFQVGIVILLIIGIINVLKHCFIQKF